jgi:hypothetical protein
MLATEPTAERGEWARRRMIPDELAVEAVVRETLEQVLNAGRPGCLLAGILPP